MRSCYPAYRLRAAGYSLLAKVSRKRCFGYGIIKAHLHGKTGLEFGGPSSIFSGNHLIPIYDIVQRIDNCNFAAQTIWTMKGDVRLGRHFGKQIIAEACDVSGIADESYDFVAASHVLEHIANPLRALSEWKRILRPLGSMLLVLPHKAGTFDHRRPFTTFEHLKADFNSNVTEADLTHLEEILELHDLGLDPAAGSPGQFRQRCLQNLTKRAIHHHVFSPELAVEMFNFLNMQVLNLAVERPYHTIIHVTKLCREEEDKTHVENSAFLSREAEWRKHDPLQG